ncbi:hypothetical protein K2173_021950 [Erythroxylum novogranatense]|uniref:Pentatricopeptide repeat-containing protein n=1 Tax=Erythroxylum novogranatense TaxID=1862640 RepID=A0AAV8T2C8_9ROSI|nr:hypothetical protein K2173_021950 [Erythroxylum novogranatense]
MRHQISKLVSDGHYREAVALYSQLHSISVSPRKFTFPPLLKACAKLKSPLQAQIVHTHVIKTGFQSHLYAATALSDMYLKLNLLHDAHNMLDEMPERNLISFNAEISGFSKNGCFREAFSVFREVGCGGFRPNSVSIASLLSACDSVESSMQVHCWAVKLGVDVDLYVGTSLVTVYSNCDEMVLARKVFEEMPTKSVVSYNAFLSGLLQNGVAVAVLDVFNDMRERSSEKPNFVSLVSVISASTSLLYLQFGNQVHGYAMKTGVGCDVLVATALVDMYSKCGRWQLAYGVFKELNGMRTLITWNAMIAGMMFNGQSDPAVELFELLKSEALEPDSATWNSMINGFVHLGLWTEAFDFFKKMQSYVKVPNLKSVTSLLRACACLSTVQLGKEIHGHAVRTHISADEFLATALIDMYMKCGYSSLACRIFDQFDIKPQDPAFWNAMICGYGKNGEDESAFKIFDQMLVLKIKPNSATFTSLLSASSHSGQVERGLQIFKMMKEYGLNPSAEHLGNVVDLLGRSGLLIEASKLIQEMPEPPASVFASLLGACRHYSNSDLGVDMAMKLSDLNPEDPTSFVILSNIYAGLGRWDDAERSRQMMSDRELTKLPAYSSIGVT